MILVTVGNHTQAFGRLIRAMDELAGQLDEKVIIQTGHWPYVAQHAESFQFTTGQHIKELTQEARAQVSHAGSGSILTALRLGTPLVVAPRLKRFEEHIDDHQLQITEALAAQGKLIAVYDINSQTLREAIEKAANLKQVSDRNGSERGRLIQAVRRELVYRGWRRA